MPSHSEASSSGSKKKREKVKAVEQQPEDGGYWECSLCTYRNKFEAFKCEMCDTRKGTSTRKPKLNENVVERQKTVQNFVVQQQEKAVTNYRKRAHQSGSPTTSRHSPASSSSDSASKASNRERNRRCMVPIPDMFIYRTSPKKVTITVDGVTATITEFRRKPIANDRVRRSIGTTETPSSEEGPSGVETK